MATLREAQKQMTRRRLLEEGLAAFAEQGYSGTTIDDIATRVGATRATFYLHFGSKAELVRALVERTNEMLTSVDNPSLAEVVASGQRAQVKTWLGHKFDQWADIKDYVTVSHQAAAVEPDIQDSIDAWFEEAIGSMLQGLEAAGRFDAASRRIRCTLAFGQLEFLSVRWFRHGWVVERDVALETMTESWCNLLCEQ